MEVDLEKYLEPNWQEESSEAKPDQAEAVEAAPSEDNKPTETQDTKTDLEKQLSEFEDKGEESKASIIDLVQQLGIIHNGTPIELKDESHVKELLSKGYDYTYKMQTFAEQRKAEEEKIAAKFQEAEAKVNEVKAYEAKIQDDLLSTNVLFKVLKKLDREDPALVAQIEEMYNSEMDVHRSSINNPVVNELQAKLAELTNKIEGKDKESVEKQNETIVKEWEEGVASVQKEWGVKLKSLGIKPNWNKVQDAWKASEAINTKQAFLAVHGEEIAKALESKQKLIETKAKSQSRQTVEPEQDKSEKKGKSVLDIAYEIANKRNF